MESRRRELEPARREHRGGGAMVRESSGGRWEEVRGTEGVLPRREIEWILTRRQKATEMVARPVTGKTGSARRSGGRGFQLVEGSHSRSRAARLDTVVRRRSSPERWGDEMARGGRCGSSLAWWRKWKGGRGKKSQ